MKQKLLSSTFPTSPAHRFQAIFLPLCVLGIAWNRGVIGGSGGVCGPLPTALPAAREATWCLELFSGQSEEGRGWGWGTERLMR